MLNFSFTHYKNGEIGFNIMMINYINIWRNNARKVNDKLLFDLMF